MAGPSALVQSGQEEELTYHWRRFFRDDRDPDTWVNRNYQLILETYYEEADLPPGMFDGKVVLDVGGGPTSGLYHSPFMLAARRIVLDPLAHEFQQMIRDDYNHYRNRKDAEEVAGYAEAIPFADRTVDCVISFNSLDHWVDWQQGIREIRRVIRPGGKMFLYVNLGRPSETPGHPHDIDLATIGWICQWGFKMLYGATKWRIRAEGMRTKSYFSLMEAI